MAVRIILLIVFQILVILQLHSQDLDLKAGGQVYRYTALLDRPLDFQLIQLNRIDFPCVDVFKVSYPETPAGQIDLAVGSVLKESWIIEDMKIYMNGFKGRDPFLNLPSREIVFLEPVMYGNFVKQDRAGSADQPNEKASGQSEFILSYNPEDLPQFFRNRSILRNVTSIQITGVLEWEMESLDEVDFYDISGRMSGRAFAHVHNYKVKEIRLRSGDWKSVTLASAPALWSLFDPKLIRFRNFYAGDDMLDRVRIQDYPQQAVIYNTMNPLYGLENCRNEVTDIYVFPNPTYGNLNLQINNASEQDFVFSIYNIIGKKLWSEDIRSQQGIFKTALNLPSLSKGVYLYTLTDSNGDIIQSRRLVIIEL